MIHESIYSRYTMFLGPMSAFDRLLFSKDGFFCAAIQSDREPDEDRIGRLTSISDQIERQARLDPRPYLPDIDAVIDSADDLHKNVADLPINKRRIIGRALADDIARSFED